MIQTYLIDSDTRLKDAFLTGGSPRRVLRLAPSAIAAYQAIVQREQLTQTARALAARLVRDGLIHPDPPSTVVADLTIVIPVRDRATELDRCLRAVQKSTNSPIIVVDDGSIEPSKVAKVAMRHQVTLITLAANIGPAAARNIGCGAASTSLVAFVDSDVVVQRGWLEGLLGHFADPVVAGVAPRIVGVRAVDTTVARLIARRSPLDLGLRAGPVIAMSRLSYVPSAALVMRRECATFDPALRYGEDVDLVWRLIAGGSQIRYEPRSVVHHLEPTTVRSWLRRRYHYGTSAAPLDVRHPSHVRPVVLDPIATAIALLLAIGRWRLAVGAYGLATGYTALRCRAVGLATNDAATDTARSVAWAASMIATWLHQFVVPALPAALLAAVRTPDRRRLSTVAAMLVVPILVDRRLLRRRYPESAYVPADVLAMLLDRAAYGLGVFSGAIALRRPAVILPKILAIPRIKKR
ncbi:MAG: mycofactocin biosynthesis glycosyltransferase MftF [Antricoccus sp.]